MGLPMRDLHTPSVPSGSAGAANSAQESDVPVLELIKKKDALEEELKALGSVLDSHGVNMNTGLTTFDGFPRADIDVAQIRTTRARIIYLRNDHKDLMKRIEKGLHAHFAEAQANPAPNPSAPSQSYQEAADPIAIPTASSAPASRPVGNSASRGSPAFATVNSVADSSPAAEAGLRPHDTIVQFGDATRQNHEKLSRVAQIVARSEGVSQVPASRRIRQAYDTDRMWTNSNKYE